MPLDPGRSAGHVNVILEEDFPSDFFIQLDQTAIAAQNNPQGKEWFRFMELVRPEESISQRRRS
jgi:hypothetical protein